MTLYQQIQSEIKTILSKQNTEQTLKKQLQTLLLNHSPKQALHQVDIQSLKQPTLLYVHLMVQDIRDQCYQYPYVIQKPFSQKSQFYWFKYGHKQPQFDYQQLDDPTYFSYIKDRQTIMCTSIFYETQWVQSIEKNRLKDKSFQMINTQINNFKLGEVFSAVCVYVPQQKILYFVRKASQEEIKLWQNLEEYLSLKINPSEVREKLLKVFSQLYSQKYSQFLLYTLLSNEHLFISAIQNHLKLFELILPRVCNLKIKVPFKQSFFPYKNQDQHLVITPMQMSNQHTFVILDFSQFSDLKQVKIQHQQIDNLKALKVYVEEGNSIYRWLHGESLIPHKNTGIIVRASSIIYPQYIVPQPKTQVQVQKKIPQISEADIRQFRCYVHQTRKLTPLLKDDRKIVEENIHKDPKKFSQQSLVKVMELSKLNAKSRGSQEIKVQDFENSCNIYF